VPVAEWNPVYLSAAVAWSLAGAVLDWRTRRVPNLLTVSGVVFGACLHLLTGGWRGLASATLAALIAMALFGVFFLAGGMGGGDVKLMAAVAAMAGMSNLLSLLLATALLGGVLAIVFAWAHRRLTQTLTRLFRLWCQASGFSVSEVLPHEPLYLPYGVAIAAGASFTFLSVVLVR